MGCCSPTRLTLAAIIRNSLPNPFCGGLPLSWRGPLPLSGTAILQLSLTVRVPAASSASAMAPHSAATLNCEPVNRIGGQLIASSRRMNEAFPPDDENQLTARAECYYAARHGSTKAQVQGLDRAPGIRARLLRTSAFCNSPAMGRQHGPLNYWHVQQ